MEKVVENKTCEQKRKQQNPWAKNSHKRSWNLNNETWANVNLNDINSKAFYWMHCTTFKGGANGSRDRENGKMFSASIYRFSFLHIYWLFICATFAAPIISREIWSVQLFGMLCVSGKYIVRLNVITVPMQHSRPLHLCNFCWMAVEVHGFECDVTRNSVASQRH